MLTMSSSLVIHAEKKRGGQHKTLQDSPEKNCNPCHPSTGKTKALRPESPQTERRGEDVRSE